MDELVFKYDKVRIVDGKLEIRSFNTWTPLLKNLAIYLVSRFALFLMVFVIGWYSDSTKNIWDRDLLPMFPLLGMLLYWFLSPLIGFIRKRNIDITANDIKRVNLSTFGYSLSIMYTIDNGFGMPCTKNIAMPTSPAERQHILSRLKDAGIQVEMKLLSRKGRRLTIAGFACMIPTAVCLFAVMLFTISATWTAEKAFVVAPTLTVFGTVMVCFFRKAHKSGFVGI